MPNSLVIVESPAKARTIGKFLGSGFTVESSIGHIRDLPRSAADVPPADKKKKWARLGVNVEADFEPYYVVDPDKRAHIKKLRDLLAEADSLYLATDEDREGEAIAWHLLEVLRPKVPVRRMVFHEITKGAIKEALEHPRDLDRRLVEAQETRRILDRLYGYELSPVLWKKVLPRLSAGRVQSVATRIIVERERERMRFRSASFWDLEARLRVPGGELAATLTTVGGSRVAAGKDFDDQGKLRGDVVVVDGERAKAIAAALSDRTLTVGAVERKPYRRSPAAPFMTSTLQQEAGRKLRFSSARAMSAAQRLYENGYITYMRTDSITLSGAAIAAARSEIEERYGADQLPASPRVYRSKVKNAQEAHEAIRPAGDRFRAPDEVARLVGPDESKLYELIWKRTVASQMEDARGESVMARFDGTTAAGEAVSFSASGTTIVFPGFLRAYVEGSDDPDGALEERETRLPRLDEGGPAEILQVEPRDHTTKPPARYTEASLVRRLEELGVGRPSTYASIIGTILDRGYVWRKGGALVPSFTAFAVVALLEKHFGDLVDYAFTARMEDDLDSISQGEAESRPWLRRFYFGDGSGRGDTFSAGLHDLVKNRLDEIDARSINSIPLGEDAEGRPIVVRIGKFGAYVLRGEDTASVPPDLTPDELDIARATELLAAPSGDRVLGNDPQTGLPVLLRSGRYGTYVQLGETSDGEKPKTSSLLSSWDPAAVTLEQALQVLALPREVGIDPSDGQPVTAQLGRYGPYVAKGKESRSLETEDQIFSVNLEQALAVLAQPRQRGRRAAAAGPLRELGNDPVSGKVISLREGRFGLYVTDGETNASLRKEDEASTLTPERAQELLQLRRDAAPSAGRTRRGARGRSAGAARGPAASARPRRAAPAAAEAAGDEGPSKKAPVKKASAKKAASKKAPAKKAASKKVPSKKAATKKTPTKGAPSRGGRDDGAAAAAGPAATSKKAAARRSAVTATPAAKPPGTPSAKSGAAARERRAADPVAE